MRGKSRWPALMLAMGLVIGGCASAEPVSEAPSGDTASQDGSPPANAVFSGTLASFDACDSFLEYVISHAVDIVGPYGLGEDVIGFPNRWSGSVLESGPTPAFAVEEDAGGFSGTNVQVEGVDEPDVVKTDGKRIVLISEGDLIVVDVSGDEPEETGRLTVGDLGVQNLFLSGDRVLMFGSVWAAHPIPFESEDAAIAPIPTSPTVQITEVDITREPELLRTMEIDGAFLSGRMVGETVRLVLTSTPVGFEWSHPSGTGIRAERKAIEENREIVRNSTEENWIPYYIVKDADGNVIDEGTLFDCDRATHPEEFSGLNMLSIVTLDSGEGFGVVDAMGLLANGDEIYASEESLYVATQNWQMWRWARGDQGDAPESSVTEIHMFDTSNSRTTDYVASGPVEGYLLNQFAMDEYDGFLRVASTSSPSGWRGSTESESRVTILRPIQDALVSVGIVDGLGETEDIYSVRFIGDSGYVVTFRQTDPLYTLDLSDPRNPTLMGELKIPGYSAYLHPISEDLLVGVGQDATDQGQLLGTQVSVFDVSDLADPERIDTFTLSKGTNSEVEYDHHAFLYWQGLAVIPVKQYWWDGGKDEMFVGAVGLEIAEDGEIVDSVDIVHPGGDAGDWDWRSQIVRSLAIDGSLYTVSAKGVMQTSLGTMEEEAWLGF